jgi:hypothetical protein
MLASNIPPITKPCSACGAYGGSQRQFSCQPGHHIEQGRFRGAGRDARLSALILENRRIQDEMIAGLARAERSQRRVLAKART